MSQHHDPVHPDSDHLTAEVLADLDLGLLDDESAERARQHLDHCAQCAALQTDLVSLADALHALNGEATEPMPDEVWDGLAQTLAAEPVRTPEGAATVVPIESSRKRRWGRPGIGLVAGAAGIALLGAILVPTLMSTGTNTASDSDDSAAASAEGTTGAPSAADFAATRSGTHYEAGDLREQVTELVAVRVALEESGATVSDQLSSGRTDDTATPEPSATETATEQTPDGSDPADGKVSRSLATVGALATSPAAAQQCLEDYLGVPGVAPLAIDIGLWEGKPAAVIVLPMADEPTLVEVWVINPTCSTSTTDDPLYYFATVSR